MKPSSSLEHRSQLLKTSFPVSPTNPQYPLHKLPFNLQQAEQYDQYY